MSKFKKDSSERNQNRHKRGWYALFALVAFVAIDHLGDLLHQLDLRRFMPWRVVLAIRNTLEVGFSVLSVAVAHRQSAKFAARELGLTAPIKPALVFAAVASAPMLLAFAIGFSINHEMTFLSVAVGCFIAPFAEEVLFRGYLFRQLYQRQNGFLAIGVNSLRVVCGRTRLSVDAIQRVGRHPGDYLCGKYSSMLALSALEL